MILNILQAIIWSFTNENSLSLKYIKYKNLTSLKVFSFSMTFDWNAEKIWCSSSTEPKCKLQHLMTK